MARDERIIGNPIIIIIGVYGGKVKLAVGDGNPFIMISQLRAC
jgi:hypothetical protein